MKSSESKKQTQEPKPNLKSRPLSFSRFLRLRQPASRWVRVVWKCEVAIATTHTTCSPFSVKKCRRGNSAFSPCICLASCLHAWCATLSELDSWRRREGRWLRKIFHKAIHHLLTTARLTEKRRVWQIGPVDQNKMRTTWRHPIPMTHLLK